MLALRKQPIFRSLDIPWSQARTTVTLVLQSTCAYCRESIPFYKRLMNAHYDKVPFAAVFPHSLDIANSYLREESLPIPIVKGGIVHLWPGIKTPTLVVFESSGAIVRVWAGILSLD